MRSAFLAGLLLVTACGSSQKTIQAERIRHQVTSDRAAMMTEERSKRIHAPEPPPRIECEIGERRSCGLPRLRMDDDEGGGPYMYCVKRKDGSQVYSQSSCNTPLVLVFDDAPVAFTDARADFHVGLSNRTEWVGATTPWLALDRNGNGRVDSERELFAGFAALAALDTNHDGLIDRHDAAFGELVLWADHNQDKQSSPDELTPLTFALSVMHDGQGPAIKAREGSLEGSFEGETAALPTRPGRLVDVYLAASR